MRALVVCSALLLVACPGDDRDTAKKRSGPASSPTVCTNVGQSCEFSPGKLGTCVQKDDCVKDCFVCQSQH